MRTPWLPVVDWTDAPADLNELVRFAERRTRMPSHFNRPLLPSIILKQGHMFVDTFTDSESWDISPVYCIGCWLHDRRIGLSHLIRQTIILFSKAWRPALGPTHFPIQWVPRAVTLSLSVRWVNLATHLHPVPRFWIREATCPLCLYLCSIIWGGSTTKLM